MTYLDAIAKGRFKPIGDRYAFYPWGQQVGYLLPTREDYWRLRYWTARVLRVCVLLTIGIWVVLGPLSIPVVGLPAFAWYRRRVALEVMGLPTTSARLTATERYRARAEAHSWTGLTLLALFALAAVATAVGVAILRPEFRATSVITAAYFAAVLAAVGFIMRLKRSPIDSPASAQVSESISSVTDES